MARRYKGPVVFVHPSDPGDGTQGVHYPVGEDGHADMSRPLRWHESGDGSWRDAKDGEPTHHEVYHRAHVELVFPGEEPIEVNEDEAAAVRNFLDEMRGGQ